MSLLEDLNQQIVAEYKSGNSEKRVLLQTLKAALLNKQKELKDKFDDEAAQGVLRVELKQRQEALPQFVSGGREDLANKTKAEIEIIQGMLPATLCEEEITKIAEVKLKGQDDLNFGQAMQAVMSEVKGRADGAVVAKVVRQIVEGK